MPRQHSQPAQTSLGQGCMHVLGVTCHLHFWENDWGLLRATAVMQGGGTDTEQESAHKVNSGEENSPASIRTRNLSITTPVLTKKLFRLHPSLRPHQIVQQADRTRKVCRKCLWASIVLDGHHRRDDIPTHAITVHKGLLQKGLEEDLC